jgi:hypothetical protein
MGLRIVFGQISFATSLCFVERILGYLDFTMIRIILGVLLITTLLLRKEAPQSSMQI